MTTKMGINEIYKPCKLTEKQILKIKTFIINLQTVTFYKKAKN
jgi:hypothetical protein